MALITGSRVYGTPREDSDVDLVLKITASEFEILRQLADPQDEEDTPYNGLPHIRFGRLNIIPCIHQATYTAWKRGTRNLIACRPVTRDEAVHEFDIQLGRA